MMTRRVLVQENGKSLFAVDIEINNHHLLGDEPTSMGGKDLGPAPFDLLTAALAECTAMTVRWYAKKHDFPLERVRVEVVHTTQKDARSNQQADAFSKTVTLLGDRLTGEQRQKLGEAAAKCPIHRTLERGCIVSTAVTESPARSQGLASR